MSDKQGLNVSYSGLKLAVTWLPVWVQLKPLVSGAANEHEALQAYGNLQVSVSKLQEENTRLQQKLLRIESEASRVSALEESNRKLTQVCHLMCVGQEALAVSVACGVIMPGEVCCYS